jgi:hypothetical protein
MICAAYRRRGRLLVCRCRQVDSPTIESYPIVMDLMEPSLATTWTRFKRRYLRRWRTVRYGDIRVHYKTHLDGGGSQFGQNYIPILKALGMPKQQRIFEWCSGPFDAR